MLALLMYVLMNELKMGHSSEIEHPSGVLVERVLGPTHHTRPM